MTTYKEVFQLAQEKGYKLQYEGCYITFGTTDQDETIVLLELTIIQKWLRDEHRINIIVRYSPQIAQQWFTTIISECYGNKPKLKDIWNFTTYEQALLEGINEALKLL